MYTRARRWFALLLLLTACRSPDAQPTDAAVDAPGEGPDAAVFAQPDAAEIDARGIDGLDAHGPPPRADGGTADAPVGADPLRIAITVHLENGRPYGEPWFAAFDELVSLFEAHGAVLTLEPREEVIVADGRRASPSLPRLRARGHEVGLHAATGDGTYDEFVRTLRARRALLEEAVGPVEHVSGNCGLIDWVGGVAEAGFAFTTAATVGCLLSIPVETRPDEFDGLTCPRGAIDPVCHRAYPDTAEGSVHAWRAASGAAWLTDDPEGAVVILPSRGTLDCIVEEMGGRPAGDCVLRDDDISIALAELDEAVRVRDPSRPAQQYWIWSYGRALDPAALERFLSAVDERVARGDVVWSTSNDAYHAFLDWEATHR